MTASFLHAQIDSCEKVYLGIFTFELLTKVLAYGFLWHPEAYLRDAWCQLDFVVVTLAWAPVLFPAMGNYSVIRSFRALRPLRALKRMPGMPKLAAAACWKRRPAPSLASAQPGLRPAWPPPSLASVASVVLAAGLGLGLRAARGSRQEHMGRTGRTGKREGRGAAVSPAQDRRRLGAAPGTQVSCVLKSIPKLSNVAMLCAFCFLVFGIVSLARSNLPWPRLQPMHPSHSPPTNPCNPVHPGGRRALQGPSPLPLRLPGGVRGQRRVLQHRRARYVRRGRGGRAVHVLRRQPARRADEL